MDNILKYIELLQPDDKLFDMTGRNVGLIVKRYNESAYPHLFRSTRVTRLIEKGATEFQTMVWFGWKDSRQPATYFRKSPKTIEDLGDKVE